MKKVFFVFLFLISFSVFAKEASTLCLTNFSATGDGIVKSNLESFPLTVTCSKESSRSDNNKGIALTSTLLLPDNWNGDVGIILYKNLMSCNVYVNDVLIDTIGRSGKTFFFQPYIS